MKVCDAFKAIWREDQFRGLRGFLFVILLFVGVAIYLGEDHPKDAGTVTGAITGLQKSDTKRGSFPVILEVRLDDGQTVFAPAHYGAYATPQPRLRFELEQRVVLRRTEHTNRFKRYTYRLESPAYRPPQASAAPAS